MTIYCPKCDQKIDIGADSRFKVYQCNNCSHRFRGIHAKLDVFGHLCGKFFLPSFMQGGGCLDKTRCPNCWTNINLEKISPTEYVGPIRCWNCRRKLPQSRVE